MVYQYDVCAFLMLALVLISIIIRKLYSGKAQRIFMIFVIVLLANSLCDMLSSVPMPGISLDARIIMREVSAHLYFILHASILPLYMVFMGLTAGTWYKFINLHKSTKLLFSLPYIVNLAAVLTNPWTNAIFRVVDGEYQRGDYILITYISGAFYALHSIFFLKRFRGALDRRSIIAFLSIYPYTILAVVLQYIYPQNLLEMFAYALAVMTITAFIIRPEATMNPVVGAKRLSAFQSDVRTFYLSGIETNVYLIKINSDSSITKLYGINRHDAIIRELCIRINSSMRMAVLNPANYSIYYLNHGLLAVSLESKHADELIAESIYDALSEKIHTDTYDLSIECVVCDISVPKDMKTAEELFNFTDTLEKSSVATGHFIYSGLTQQEKIRMNFDIDRYIRKAIANRSFSMYYQPIYSVRDNKFVTAEALIRLIDDEVGFISPADFIPAAEKSGAIYDIGNFVIDSVFGFVKQVKPYGVQYIEINISAMQCMNDSFVDEVKDKFAEYGISNKEVNFELTESASEILDDVLRRTVALLHAEGVEFSIDDYGTGYSNLHRIMSEPIKIIKIDRSLISNLDDDKTRAVLADTIRMIKSIGIEIVAEGVETEETARWLIDKGCDFIQGYYYAKPRPEDQYIAFLQEISRE